MLKRVRNSVLELMRTNPELTWSPDDYWWLPLQELWTTPGFLRSGEAIQELDLYEALVDAGVDGGKIVNRGAHTFIELDNIDFVCRSRHFKYGNDCIHIAPHIKGLKFSKCGHSVIAPCGEVADLVWLILFLDWLTPKIKETARQAYFDGLKERKIREIEACLR